MSQLGQSFLGIGIGLSEAPHCRDKVIRTSVSFVGKLPQQTFHQLEERPELLLGTFGSDANLFITPQGPILAKRLA